MTHVGDVDLQGEAAVIQALHPDGVVEIARGFAVDGDDIERAEIAAAGKFGFRDRSGKRARLGENLVGEMMRDVMRADEDFDVDAEIVRAAENFDDAAGGAVVRRPRNRGSPR